MYVLEDSLEMTDLADAIRAKTGSAGDLTVADMITEVSGISGGGGLSVSDRFSSIKITPTWVSVSSGSRTTLSDYLNQTQLDNLILIYGVDGNKNNLLIGFPVESHMYILNYNITSSSGSYQLFNETTYMANANYITSYIISPSIAPPKLTCLCKNISS